MWSRRGTWEPGGWPRRSDRQRVLVEDPDGALRTASERLLQREGFDVAVCPGPEEMGSRHCPAVACGECPLVEGADVVYANLRWSLPASREVLQAHRTCYAGTPVVVEVSQPEETRSPELFAGCTVVHVPVGGDAMVGAIRKALATHS